MNFLLEERGQDLIEYALLLAFIMVAAAAMLLVNTQSITGIWISSNELISSANHAANGGSS